MPADFDLTKFKGKAKLKDRYLKQLQRLQKEGIAAACIEEAVNGAVANLSTANTSSLVIYGEPQSGKTEMMICLTAKLLDEGRPIIVHLMNDRRRSVDSESQEVQALWARSRGHRASRSTREFARPSGAGRIWQENVHDLDKLIESAGKIKARLLWLTTKQTMRRPTQKLTKVPKPRSMSE